MVFFSTYKLYKQGTAQVVAWLGKTAAKCGYELHPADTSTPEKVMKKGSKSNKNSSTKSAAQVTKLVLSVNQLPVLAKFISERFHQVSDFKTLPSIVAVLKDVISKRKEWAKRFERPDVNGVDNLRHEHFVNVLDEVFQTLRAVLSASEFDKGPNPPVTDHHENSASEEEMALSNVFAVLALDESKDLEGGSNNEKTAPKLTGNSSRVQPHTTTYELDNQLGDEEVVFMIYCFFEDFQQVRHFLDQSWSDYKLGMLDLPTVAVTTNVAVQMLQRAEKALLEALPKDLKIAGYEKVGIYLYMAIAVGRGINPSFRYKTDDVINMDLQDIADFTCLPVSIILKSFLPVLAACPAFPVYKPGFFGKIDSSGRPLSWRDRFKQDKIILLEFLPEFCYLSRLKVKMPVVDELSRGLIEMMETKQIPIWLVLACQLYLDIFDTMFKGVGYDAHKQLQDCGQHVSKTVQEYLDFSKEMWLENWPEENDKALRILKLEADMWVNQDYCAFFQKKLLKAVNLPESSVRPYGLLSRHPILCGLMMFRLNLKLQEAGVTVVTARGSLPTVLHLYNAVKQELAEVGFPLWEDAENVIQIQSKEQIFVGEYPKNAEEYLKQFALVMGYSATSFGRNIRDGGRPRASKHGPREMIKTSTMADVFHGEICGSQPRSDITFHKIEQAITKVSPERKSGTRSEGKARPFTSVSFLSSLQAQIESESLALNMNYVGLHIRCFNLLRDIKLKLDPDFRKYLGPNYVERESEFPFLVGYLFLIATQSGKAGEILLKVRSDSVKSMILLKAGDILRDLVNKEGNREMERVRSVCCGFN
jgi:hypothetical protein